MKQWIYASLVIAGMIMLFGLLAMGITDDERDSPRPIRILQRDDGLYELERRYGRYVWTRIGEYYDSLAAAKASCKWFRNSELENIEARKKAKLIKKKVVHECR